MESKLKRLVLSIFTVAIVFALSVDAYAGLKKGMLVELSSVSKSITIEIEGSFAEKRIVTYKVADDARWHICLKEKCIDKKGVDGFRAVNEFARFGDYGIPHKTYSILLDITGDTATALEVQIITKIH